MVYYVVPYFSMGPWNFEHTTHFCNIFQEGEIAAEVTHICYLFHWVFLVLIGRLPVLAYFYRQKLRGLG